MNIITLLLENAPEALHGSIVNTLAYPRHTLCHSGRNQLVVKYPGGVLEPPVAVEQRMSVRVGGKGAIQGFMYQGAVVGVSEDKGDNPSAAQVQNGAEAELMNR